jgi:glutamate--cysteine ligase
MLTLQRLQRSDVAREVAELFAASPVPAGVGPGQVGLELELIPARIDASPPEPVAVKVLQQLLATDSSLGQEARITFEPGGQLELSPGPYPSAAQALSRAAELTARARSCLAPAAIELFSSGTNPWHTVDQLGLQTPAPRYVTQQAHYDEIGPAGRRMMRQTAALMVCLDLGPPDVAIERWRLANFAGPVLAAALANSPLLEGKATGIPGTRTSLWTAVDPSRTGYDGLQVGELARLDSARGGYLDFALHAEFMALPRNGEKPPLGHATLAEWLAGDGPDANRPDHEDLAHHISTLFPPVRPRGYLEIRYIDAPPERWLAVPVITLTVLLYEPDARREALEALEAQPIDMTTWTAAATLGFEEDELRASARELFHIAERGIGRMPAGYLPDDAAAQVAAYRERFVDRRRTLADEQLERHQRDPEDLSTWR